jgi:methionine-rich copper-binding protein CopC
MRGLRKIAALALLAATLIGPGPPVAAWAHAFPSAEQPLVGSTVTTPPARVTIMYDAPIESLFARLEVLNAAARTRPTVRRRSAPTVARSRSSSRR